MASFDSLEELTLACTSCTACSLSKTRTKVVPGEGHPNAQVMFIGEGPGYHEDRQGRPFVGPAGKILDELIGSIGLSRNEVYIANIVKCRPPGNRDPVPIEVESCKQWLDPQIELVNPKVIVTLGRYSLSKFIPKETITRVHGTPRKIDGRIVLPVHHPAAALYQRSLLETIREDFKKLPPLLADPAPSNPDRLPPNQVSPDKPQQLSLFE